MVLRILAQNIQKIRKPWLKCIKLNKFYQVAWSSTSKNKFWEADRKGGYETSIEMPFHEKVKDGFKHIKPETVKWTEEVIEKIRCDAVFDRQPGDYEILWKFEKKGDFENWVLTADSCHSEGNSWGTFEISDNKTGIFRGNTDTYVPKDGILNRAGYVNIRSPMNFKSFHRQISYDWSRYNCLMLRVRGDGRRYMLIIGMDRYFDIQWNDQYQFPLYTHGGPYWQTEMIPFTKFFLSAKGRIQDKQENMMHQMDKIRFLGITSCDGNNGSFKLEIDHIGLYYDASLNEETVYEMYEANSNAALN